MADVDKCSSFTRIESARAVAVWCGCLCSRQSGQRTVFQSVIFWVGFVGTLGILFVPDLVRRGCGGEVVAVMRLHLFFIVQAST